MTSICQETSIKLLERFSLALTSSLNFLSSALAYSPLLNLSLLPISTMEQPPSSHSQSPTAATEDDLYTNNGEGDRMEQDDGVTSNQVERDARNRIKLVPLGDMFFNKGEVLKVIYMSIHTLYNSPWKTFCEVPQAVKNQWWKDFENHFFWEDCDGPLIKQNWQSKCGKHISNSFCEARSKGFKPRFVSTDNWEIMTTEWKNSEKFQRISAINKRNRASEGEDDLSHYDGGSKSTTEYKQEFLEKHGRPMTQEELMQETYHSKKTGTWTTERPKKCLERFEALKRTWLESYSVLTQDDEWRLWCEAVGGEKKGHIFGQGSLARKGRYVLNPPARASSSSPIAHARSPLTQAPSPPTRAPSPLTHVDQPNLGPSPLPHGPSMMNNQSQVDEGMPTPAEMRIIARYRELQAYEEQLKRRGMCISQGMHPSVPQPEMSFQSLLNSRSNVFALNDQSDVITPPTSQFGQGLGFSSQDPPFMFNQRFNYGGGNSSG